MKKIFERILQAVKTLENNSQTAFAKKIGCQQSTFNTYLNDEGQKRIRLTLIENILLTYPQISRDWLFFAEGSMLEGGLEPDLPKDTPLLTCAPVSIESNERITCLEKELSEAKDKIIALQEELLEQTRNAQAEAQNKKEECTSSEMQPTSKGA